MKTQKYWYVSGPLLVLLGIGLIMIIEKIVAGNAGWWMGMHVFMLPTILLVWAGIFVSIATIGYGIVYGIQKLFTPSRTAKMDKNRKK